jgi:molybdopterin-guanine dinucleotide biosynthesis protein A
MNIKTDITGVILAGGQSSRFGSNKALALFKGKPLIQHVADSMAAVFSECLLATNSPDQYEFLLMESISDLFQGMGPLAGIHAALHHTDNQWVFVIGCDMPTVSPEVIKTLCSFTGEQYEAVIPWPEKGAEPLCGLYHKAALKKVELQLKRERPMVKELLGMLNVRKVKEQEIQGVTGLNFSFASINRQQDLDSLQ